MKKMMTLVAGMAMAVVLTGCGGSKDSSAAAEQEAAEGVGSAKGVAERFVNAIIQKKVDAAYATCSAYSFDKRGGNVQKRSKADVQKLKKELEGLGEELGNDKLQGKAIKEVINGGPRYLIVDGKKFNAHAVVTVQLMQDKVKTSKGIRVELRGGDEGWKVTSCDTVSGLDTSDGEEKPSKKVKDDKRGRSKDDDRKERHADRSKPAPKAKAEAKKDAKAYVQAPTAPARDVVDAVKAADADYGSSNVRKFERQCREMARLAKQAGEKVSESDIQEKIDEFKKASARDQEKMLKELEKMLEYAREAVKAHTKEDSKKADEKD